MKSITSKYIINRRKEISDEITKNWEIISKFNVTSKEMPAKFKTNYDLKELIKKNVELMEERIMLKLYLQCINMGYKEFCEIPETNNYYTIYTLSERTEYLFKLNHIPTLSKRAKRLTGKKNMEENEVITSDYIDKLKKPLELEILSLKEKIEKFNKDATLDIEKAPTFLTT